MFEDMIGVEFKRSASLNLITTLGDNQIQAFGWSFGETLACRIICIGFFRTITRGTCRFCAGNEWEFQGEGGCV